jgi:RES domain-containing protein
VIVWRISNHISLSGDGGMRASGRWHTRGRRVVCCADSPAAALLEILVHLEIEVGDLPERYRLLKIDVPDAVDVTRVSLGDLPADWRHLPEATRSHGDRWLASARTAVLVVPSALVPDTRNILVNPAHMDARRVVVLEANEHPIDPRLLS